MKTNQKRLAFAKEQENKNRNEISTLNTGINKQLTLSNDGFGYEWDGEKWFHIKHTGRIILEKDVDIHPLTVIVRGTGDKDITFIGQGTKIDCLCHIAHNVKIGKHCLIGSRCGISGSVQIGDYVRIGSNVTILKKLKIGNHCQILDGSVVRRDLKDGEIFSN